MSRKPGYFAEKRNDREYTLSVRNARKLGFPSCEKPSTGVRTMLEFKPLFTALVATMFLASLPGISLATDQAQQRRAGRDVKQDTRQDSRQTKQACRAGDEQSNSACRQDKRGANQEGRKTARDMKY